MKEIQAQQEVVATIKKEAAINKTALGGTYWSAANTLANLLTKYFFLQNSNVEDITYSAWEQNGGSNYEGNYVKLNYTDSEGKSQTAYFDYENANSDGKGSGDCEECW